MIFYKLGLVSDAFSISAYDFVAVFILFAVGFCLALFLFSNLSDDYYASNRLEDFLQEHRILTYVLMIMSSLLAAFMIFLSVLMLVVTVPGTIVDNRYILEISARNVEVKDDFKTIYANEENVEFSSILDSSIFNNLPQDLLDDLRTKEVRRENFAFFRDSRDLTIFSTKSDLNYQQVEALKIFSKHKQVIEINASKSDQSVKVLATIDSVEVTKEEENEENLTYHIDKIEMADAVETISRDSQSKSRDIKSIRIHISGKTSKSAKDQQSIEKLLE